MSLNSMTGFARANGEAVQPESGSDGYRWMVEVKSVNARGLDLKLRAPAGMEALDSVLREACEGKISRGSLQVFIHLENAEAQGTVAVNEAALQSVLRAVRQVQAEIDTAPPQPEAILALRGVLEGRDQRSERASEEVIKAVGATVVEAVEILAKARAQEGARLAAIVQAQIDDIERLARELSQVPGAGAPAIREKLSAQIAELVQGGLSDERLAHEVALLATKSDIREEIDRLLAHVGQARDLLAEGKPAGRRLDFLAQEFNREANTVCSKAADIEITRLGLALKAVIDQFREQVQNVE